MLWAVLPCHILNSLKRGDIDASDQEVRKHLLHALCWLDVHALVPVDVNA